MRKEALALVPGITVSVLNELWQQVKQLPPELQKEVALWGQKVTVNPVDEKKPPFPMAAHYLVAQGKVTLPLYRRQRSIFSGFDRRYMKPEYCLIARRYKASIVDRYTRAMPIVHSVGVGSGEDVPSLLLGYRMAMDMMASDYCPESILLAQAAWDARIKPGEISGSRVISFGEMGRLFSPRTKDRIKTPRAMYRFSRTWQHTKEEQLYPILPEVNSERCLLPDGVIVLVHPFPEFNLESSYQHTFGYTLTNFLDRLNAKARKPLVCLRKMHLKWFEVEDFFQVYTWMTLGPEHLKPLYAPLASD